MAGFDVPMRFYSNGIQPIQGGLAEPLLAFWQRWDAIHYQSILSAGYSVPWISAFFPLYPLLGRGVHALTGLHPLGALMVVSSIAALLALVVLYELVEEDYGTPVARAAVVAALLLPTSFFFFTPYPSSLSLLFILLAYRWARRRQYLLAGLAGLAGGLTHGTGVPLVLLLGVVVLRDLWPLLPLRAAGKSLLRFSALAVPFTPLMGTALFLAWRMAQGFPGYAALLESKWARGFEWPWISLLNLPVTLLGPYTRWSGWSDTLLMLLAFIALAWSWKKLEREQWVYFAAALFFILSTPVRSSPLVGFGRYGLMMFPLYSVLGMWAQNLRFKRLAFAPALLAQFVLVTFYFFWMWVD